MKKKGIELTRAKLVELFYIDDQTGLFRWAIPWGNIKQGYQASGKIIEGVRYLNIYGIDYDYSILQSLYHTGEKDHKDYRVYKTPELTREYLTSLFYYEGKRLYWNVHRGRIKPGDICNKEHVRIDGKLYKTHKVIWTMFKGEYKDTIHKGEDPFDIDTLEMSSKLLHDKRLSTGKRDQGIFKQGKKYKSTFGGEYLGMFNTLEEAIKARLVKVKEHFKRIGKKIKIILDTVPFYKMVRSVFDTIPKQEYVESISKDQPKDLQMDEYEDLSDFKLCIDRTISKPIPEDAKIEVIEPKEPIHKKTLTEPQTANFEKKIGYTYRKDRKIKEKQGINPLFLNPARFPS